MTQSIHMIIDVSLLALLIVSMLVAGTLYAFRRLVINALHTLSMALDAVGRGDLDYSLPDRLPDVFTPIIKGYNTMRSILRDRQQALTVQLRRTSLLTQISIELRGTLNPTTISERVLRVLGTSLPIDTATILLTLPENPQPIGMRFFNHHIQHLSQQQVTQLLTLGLEGRVQQQGSSIVLNDIRNTEDWYSSNGDHTGSAIILALRHDTDTLGSLTVYAQQPDTFTNHDLLLLEGIVSQTSVAISLGLRFQTERQQRDEAIALLEMSHRELQRSRDFLRIVFDHLPEGLILLDHHGEILATNNAFCRGIVGQNPRTIVGKRYHQIWKDLAQQSDLSLTPQGPSESGIPLIPTEEESFPITTAAWRVLCSDIVGQQRWYAVDRIPISEVQHDSNQCLERWRDITHQEELQRRLLVHEQLSSLGRLAASVAHEVGNPLQSALGCLELCRTDTGMHETSREYLELALGELDRMARTMSSLRNLYRPPQITWEQVDLNQLLQQVGQFTQRQLTHAKIKITFQLAERLPPITGQPDALRQVFLNLVLNAQEAMAHGGEIQISTVRKLTDRLCHVTIRDTGIGMSNEQLKHIFEPFRSMKAQGVGLGLYLSRQIIEQHTGHIAIASQLGQGTTITIQFPWSDAGPWWTPEDGEA